MLYGVPSELRGASSKQMKSGLSKIKNSLIAPEAPYNVYVT